MKRIGIRKVETLTQGGDIVDDPRLKNRVQENSNKSLEKLKIHNYSGVSVLRGKNFLFVYLYF